MPVAPTPDQIRTMKRLHDLGRGKLIATPARYVTDPPPSYEFYITEIWAHEDGSVYYSCWHRLQGSRTGGFAHYGNRDVALGLGSSAYTLTPYEEVLA